VHQALSPDNSPLVTKRVWKEIAQRLNQDADSYKHSTSDIEQESDSEVAQKFNALDLDSDGLASELSGELKDYSLDPNNS
jgi:hypothetical protein